MPPTSIVPLAAPASADLLRLTGVEVVHRGRPAPSVQGIDLRLASGECLAIAGPSGAGKTSLAHAILGLLPHRGQVTLAGAPVTRATRRQIQLVFQNPMASLDPTQTAGDAIAEALHLARAPVSTASVAALLAQVGLPAALMPRRPATLSGGQAQRLAIARALAAAPALLVLDEPTASLDVSNAAALLALLRDLAARNGLGYIVITHDLAVAVALAHRLAIMNEGRIVETGDTAEVIRNPVHACTRALVEAASHAA